MFKRSQSRLRARSLRSSSASPRVHQEKAHLLGFLGVILLLFTVAFLHSKLGSPSSAKLGSSNEFSLGRRLITEWPTDTEGASNNGVTERAILDKREEANKLSANASREFEVMKARNSSLEGDYDHDDDDVDEDTLDEDVETGTELEIDELENANNNAVEGFNEMDEDDGDDEDKTEEEQEEPAKIEVDASHSRRHSSDDLLSYSAIEKTFKGKNSDNQISQDSTVVVDKVNVDEQVKGNVAIVQKGHAKVEHQQAKAVKSLQRLDGIKTIPRWDPLEGLERSNEAVNNFSRTIANKERAGIMWDHLLGVARRTSERKYLFPQVLQPGGRNSEGVTNSSTRQSHTDFLTDAHVIESQIFTSDDELLDQDISNKLEEVTAIEDALLLPTEKTLGKRLNKGDSNKKERPSKGTLDPLNPANNPLLQDPDTVGPNGLTASDRAILKAFRKARDGELIAEPGQTDEKVSIRALPSLQEKHREENENTSSKEHASINEMHEVLDRQRASGTNAAERSILEVSAQSMLSNSMMSGAAGGEALELLQRYGVLDTKKEEMVDKEFQKASNPERKIAQHEQRPSALMYLDAASVELKPAKVAVDLTNSNMLNDEIETKPDAGTNGQPKSELGDQRKWGFYPGLDPFLSFSEFLDQFLTLNNCSLRVFMAWTTPSWMYTVRYQRGLESVLHFHPQACIIVFSESIELNFFSSFVEEGFKIAVAVPNLEELLKGTPTEVFASIWLTWRKIDLFHIHYTELLRLAALYKYGGIYLDTDVIVLKPLDLLHNTFGVERMRNHTQKLNGAVMAFEKDSPFLLECLAEFTATYDEQLLEYNGAGLLTRVAHRLAQEDLNTDLLASFTVQPPQVFFPLERGKIRRYFKASIKEHHRRQDDELLQLIANESLTLHFWNQKTARLVPEVGSLVEKVINSHCLRCHDYL